MQVINKKIRNNIWNSYVYEVWDMIDDKTSSIISKEIQDNVDDKVWIQLAKQTINKVQELKKCKL